MWKGINVDGFTITIPPGVKVLKIETDQYTVNDYYAPDLPAYIGVTGGKTYNMRVAAVADWKILVHRYNSPSDNKYWVRINEGEDIEGSNLSRIQIIMSYSASINGVIPKVLDY